jgi:hypothetical protein
VDADWYPDPSNPSQQRFWDGVGWTHHIYGAQGQSTDAGLQGAPPPGVSAEFPEIQPAPPVSPGYPHAAAPSYPPPDVGAYAPGYGPAPGSGPAPGQGPGYGPGPSYPPPGGSGFGAPPAYGPRPGYGPPGVNQTGFVGAQGAWPGGGRPIGQTTSIGIQILLTIVTFGIWALVWTYRQYRDMHNYTGTGISGGVGLLISIVPIGNIVTYFLLASEVENMYERDGQKSPVSAVYGLFAFIPLVGTLVWYIVVQRAINQFWVARGAPPP